MSNDDPLMPDDVRRAKRLRYKVTERADMGIMEDVDKDKFMPTEDITSSEECSLSESVVTSIQNEGDDAVVSDAPVVDGERNLLTPSMKLMQKHLWNVNRSCVVASVAALIMMTICWRSSKQW